MTMTHDTLLPAFPETSLTSAALEYLRECQEPYLFNHSVRSYLCGRLVGDAMGLVPDEDYDLEAMFFCSALHDLGLTKEAVGEERFEVEGADIAVRFLGSAGYPSHKSEWVWDAIALHATPGILNRKRAELRLSFFGTATDVIGVGAEEIPSEVAVAIHELYPRLGVGEKLPKAVVAQVEARPQKAPLYSTAAGLAQEFGCSHAMPTWRGVQKAHPWHEYE